LPLVCHGLLLNMERQTPQVFAVGSSLGAVRGLRSGTTSVLQYQQKQFGAFAEYEHIFSNHSCENMGVQTQPDRSLQLQPVAPRPPATRGTRQPSIAQLRRKLKRATEDKGPVAERSGEAPPLAITLPTSIQLPFSDHGRKPFVRRMHRSDTLAGVSSNTSLVTEHLAEVEDGVLTA